MRSFGCNFVRLTLFSVRRVRLEYFLDNFSYLVLCLDGFSSLLLHSVDAACFLVELNEGLSCGIFDLKCLGRFADGDAVLLGEFDEHSPRLRGDRVVMVSLLCVCLLLWNFGEHFTSTLDYIGFLILKLSINSD